MREEILSNLDNPIHLERLYRKEKTKFRNAFNELYPQIGEHVAGKFWHERLNFEKEEISWGSKSELLLIVLASLVAGFIAKLPDLFKLDEEYYYARNIGFVAFPLLAIYFGWKRGLHGMGWLITAFSVGASAVYINSFQFDDKSDTIVLACIHLPLFLWAVTGFAFTGGKLRNHTGRIDFLRYNGDLMVMTAVILIAGGILSGITIGLFSMIDLHIEEFYLRYIAIWGVAASPIVGTYLVQTNPQLVNKVSPVIAKVFTPIVIVTLIVYLIAVIKSGKDPYNDREFLIIFNLLLIGVMAIIFFAVAETTGGIKGRFNLIMLLLLALITIVINSIALSAIVFRISEWGMTPNRLAVLGSNVLILINLVLMAYRLFNASKNPDDIGGVEKSIAVFLPIYTVWTMLVIFLFPILFGFS